MWLFWIKIWLESLYCREGSYPRKSNRIYDLYNIKSDTQIAHQDKNLPGEKNDKEMYIQNFM